VLAKDWQRRFACSASTSLVPGMIKEREILMQGRVAHEVEQYLIDVCRIPRDLIVNKCAAKKQNKGAASKGK
jgi:translation initiation factor 1 (eIF-1/SUI1)